MVLGQGMRLIALGETIGLVAALAMSRVLAKLLFQVGATDLWTFAAWLSSWCSLPRRPADCIPPRRHRPIRMDV
jgi:hypothetical protein